MSKGKDLTPLKLVDNLKEKIKIEFVNLVPEEEWDQLIKSTIDEFKEKELKMALKDILREEVKRILVKHITEITAIVWDPGQQRNMINNELRQMILSMAPQIITQMIQGQLQHAIENMRYSSNY